MQSQTAVEPSATHGTTPTAALEGLELVDETISALDLACAHLRLFMASFGAESREPLVSGTEALTCAEGIRGQVRSALTLIGSFNSCADRCSRPVLSDLYDVYDIVTVACVSLSGGQFPSGGRLTVSPVRTVMGLAVDPLEGVRNHFRQWLRRERRRLLGIRGRTTVAA